MTPAERSAVLIDAVVAILRATPDAQLNITVLNKALFYLDLRSLRDTGRRVIDFPFIAIREGPVVGSYEKRIVKKLEQEDLAVQHVSPVGRAKPVQLLPESDSLELQLPERQIRIAESVGKWAAKKTSTWISNYSHKNPGWNLAWITGQGAGAKPLAVDMNIALLQILDEDPWIEDSLDQSEKEAVRQFSLSDAETWTD